MFTKIKEFLFGKTSEPVKETPAPSAPYKVPEPVATTPIPLIVETPVQIPPVIESAPAEVGKPADDRVEATVPTKPARKPAARKPVAPKKPAAPKPAPAKKPAAPKPAPAKKKPVAKKVS